VPDGAGLDHGRRKAVEGESDESSGVSAETAGDVPQRSAEKESAGQERKAREPAPSGIEQPPGADKQRRFGYEREKWRVLGIEAVDIVGNFNGKRAWGLGKRRAGDAAAMKLAPASGETGLLGVAGAELSRQLGRVKFGMD
jgi:hypothetical protein